MEIELLFFCFSPNDLANFLSAHLTNPYSDNMAEPQQTRWHSPPGMQKSQDFLYLAWADRFEPSVASRGICNESVGAKFTRNQ